MPQLDVTDTQLDRIDALKEELADIHGGPYATVERDHVLTYLLDLADAVEDPRRTTDVDGASGTGDFPADRLAAALAERTLQYADGEDREEMDLYTMAEVYDIDGRSQMTKDELVDALVEAVETRYRDPLAPVDLSLADLRTSEDAAGDRSESGDVPTEELAPAAAPSGETDGTDPAPETPAETDPAEAGGSPLTANLSLLEEHADKWHEGEGDARYEVELPDGSVETARTQDDVRALLYKNY